MVAYRNRHGPVVRVQKLANYNDHRLVYRHYDSAFPDCSATYISDQMMGDKEAQPMGDKIKVLMVDDEEKFRSTTEKILQRKGFETVLAASGEEAINKLGEQPDVVILDVKMPGMDGHFSRSSGYHAYRSWSPAFSQGSSGQRCV
jgi:PleD family two-component response regulator